VSSDETEVRSGSWTGTLTTVGGCGARGIGLGLEVVEYWLRCGGGSDVVGSLSFNLGTEGFIGSGSGVSLLYSTTTLWMVCIGMGLSSGGWPSWTVSLLVLSVLGGLAGSSE